LSDGLALVLIFEAVDLQFSEVVGLDCFVLEASYLDGVIGTSESSFSI
jgi:hypothetical protein